MNWRLSRPVRIFAICSLPIICYTAWIHHTGSGFLKPCYIPNELDRFAIRTMDSLNPISIEIKHEVGGRLIYIHGHFEDNGIILGSKDGTKLPRFLQTPWTGRCLADFHTHGDDDPIYDNENFSKADTLDANEIMYLETPRGKIWKHIPGSDVTFLYDRHDHIWIPIKHMVTKRRMKKVGH